jgi:cytochrome bd-type quinol oxidase subunit 1
LFFWENALTDELTKNAVDTNDEPSLDLTVEEGAHLELENYNPEKRRDYVRLAITVGLLAILAFVVVWACIESASWKDHWDQTKEMLQIILPALLGLIGSALGFYFGTAGRGRGGSGHGR